MASEPKTRKKRASKSVERKAPAKGKVKSKVKDTVVIDVNPDISNMEPLSLNEVHCIDCIEGLKRMPSTSVDVLVCDPPYNIGKDFGNQSDKQEQGDYLAWCEEWIRESYRVMKPSGLCYIFGFSETLSLIHANMVLNGNYKWRVRWLVWHYTNKTRPTLNFWQRTHESVLCCYFPPTCAFNRDLVREPYGEEFLNNYPGKTRASTPGRINHRNITTVYTAHPNGALPRDVIKIPALSGAYGKRERVDHPSQKPLELCEKLIQSGINVGNPEATVVVAPFAGAGTELVAAKKLNCRYIGFEINETYVALCNERLANIEQAILETSYKSQMALEAKQAKLTGSASSSPLAKK